MSTKVTVNKCQGILTNPYMPFFLRFERLPLRLDICSKPDEKVTVPFRILVCHWYGMVWTSYYRDMGYI